MLFDHVIVCIVRKIEINVLAYVTGYNQSTVIGIIICGNGYIVGNSRKFTVTNAGIKVDIGFNELNRRTIGKERACIPITVKVYRLAEINTPVEFCALRQDRIFVEINEACI